MIAGGVWIDMKCLAGTVDGLRAARIDSDGRAHVFME